MDTDPGATKHKSGDWIGKEARDGSDGCNDIAMKREQRGNKMKSGCFPLAWVWCMSFRHIVSDCREHTTIVIAAVDLMLFYHLSCCAGHRFSIVCLRCHSGIFCFCSGQSSHSQQYLSIRKTHFTSLVPPCLWWETVLQLNSPHLSCPGLKVESWYHGSLAYPSYFTCIVTIPSEV